MPPTLIRALVAVLLAAVVAAAPRASSGPACGFDLRTAELMSRIPGEYIVSFRREAVDRRAGSSDPAARARAVEGLAFEMLEQVGGGEVVHVWEHALLGVAVRELSARAARRLGRHPAVERIEPNRLVYATAYPTMPSRVPAACR